MQSAVYGNWRLNRPHNSFVLAEAVARRQDEWLANIAVGREVRFKPKAKIYG